MKNLYSTFIKAFLSIAIIAIPFLSNAQGFPIHSSLGAFNFASDTFRTGPIMTNSLTAPSGTLNFGSKLAINTTYIPSGYTLAVDGSIIAQDLLVQLYSSWPDYVFNKAYKILTIEELEDYVNSKKHLPGLPSAHEVSENGGFKVGEIVKEHTEKLEELTLYIIQLNKEVKELREENEKLKEAIDKK